MRYEWSRRLALTKQSNPRPAKNDPSTHDKIETNRNELGERTIVYPTHRAYDVRPYAKSEAEN
jgi:hypothetical protein